MTTTVKRGAGRPAATVNSNRHAQRTLLPPKAKRDAIREENVAQILAEDPSARYGMMKVAELRKVAEGLLVKGSRSMRKGELLNAILEAEKSQAKVASPERVARAEAKVDAMLKPSALDAKLEMAFGSGDLQDEDPATPTRPSDLAEANKRLDSKSGAKAEAFIHEAMRLGWTAEAILKPGDHTIVTVKREAEAIVIEWMGGVFQDNCTYTHAGRTPIKLRNASAAKQRMAVAPAKANEEATKVTAHKAVRAKAGTGASGSRSGRKLPFTEASLDQEVLDAVYGRRIAWTNSISGAEEDDRVPALAETVRLQDGTPGKRKQNHAPRITEGPRGRVLEFVGAAGFRSVLLASITRVR